jgi:hypothetical protein
MLLVTHHFTDHSVKEQFLKYKYPYFSIYMFHILKIIKNYLQNVLNSRNYKVCSKTRIAGRKHVTLQISKHGVLVSRI